jgi:hypothetical protein
MTELDTATEPDWDAPLELVLTPAGLFHALFHSASTVHTGWSSCVDPALILADLSTMDDASGNYCRMVEQEYVEDDNEEKVWHDWLVEIRLGEVLISGHWQLQASAPPLDWDWASREAETAFEKACILFGKRARRTLVVDEPQAQTAAVAQRPRHH